jgi:hypothetical protein
MTPEQHARLQHCLACHGPDLLGWPEDARSFGYEMESDAQALPLFRAEERLHSQLEGASIPDPSAQLAERIIAASRRVKRVSERPWALTDLLAGRRPALYAALVMAGLAIGYNIASPSQFNANAAPATADEEMAAL